jgi:hypothetical protein
LTVAQYVLAGNYNAGTYTPCNFFAATSNGKIWTEQVTFYGPYGTPVHLVGGIVHGDLGYYIVDLLDAQTSGGYANQGTSLGNLQGMTFSSDGSHWEAFEAGASAVTIVRNSVIYDDANSQVVVLRYNLKDTIWELATYADTGEVGVTIPGGLATPTGALYNISSSSYMIPCTGPDAWYFSANGDDWTVWRASAPANLQDYKYDSVHVAAYAGPLIESSTDGVTWTNWVPSSTGGTTLYRIAHGSGVWLAVGDDGNYYTSTDAVNWTLGTLAWTGASDCAFLNGTFVIACADGKVYTSANGSSWTLQTTLASGDVTLAVGNGLLLLSILETTAFGNVSRKTRALYSSSNGIVWTSETPAIPNVPAFYPTAMTWDETSKLYYAAGYNIFNSSPSIFYSGDGIFWTFKCSLSAPCAPSSIAAYNGRLYIVGWGNLNGSFTTYNVWTSDFETWTPLVLPAQMAPYKIAVVNQSLYIVGNDATGWNPSSNSGAPVIMQSSDGVSWTQCTILSGVLGATTIFDIAYGNSVYFAIGYDSSVTSAVTFASANGQVFTPNYPAAMANTIQRAIAFCKGRFLTVGATVPPGAAPSIFEGPHPAGMADTSGGWGGAVNPGQVVQYYTCASAGAGFVLGGYLSASGATSPEDPSCNPDLYYESVPGSNTYNYSTLPTVAFGTILALVGRPSAVETTIIEEKVFIRWSDDRGKTWSTPLEYPLGEQGEYFINVAWRDLGIARFRIYELFWTSSSIQALNGAFVEVQELQ